MKTMDEMYPAVPALVLDEEEAIEDLSATICAFQQGLGEEFALYSPSPTDGGVPAAREKLQSVLAATFCTYFGQSPAGRFADLFDQATYLAQHLAKDHLFQDGNKRTALTAALAILRSAGACVAFDDTDDPATNRYYAWIQDIVSGARSSEALSEELKQSAAIG
ncbi:Fic family protein [uncultured Parolsenella sp.]|uniref:Fic family protein n=1 Tax=uncultured Parolsenella sp. TaxID=2083008 RepID=UPI0025F07C20|nr:Fic family protein [uncultured Parolsenella sp.]